MERIDKYREIILQVFKEHIVLGFRSPEIRQYTGYTVE